MDSLSFYGIPEWAEPGIRAVAFVLARVGYWWFSVT
jgi:hypothetical protein